MAKWQITYRTRPLGLNAKFLAKEAMPEYTVELEADSHTDVLTKYSAYQHERNIERTGYTSDILDVKEME